MRTIAGLFAVFLAFSGCIGWSSEQKEVVDSYNEIRLHAENARWSRLIRSCTEDTEDLLKALANLYTSSGAPFEDDPVLFLEALAMETGVLFFPEAILSVEITGDRALLTAEGEDDFVSYEFKRESGEWKIDFQPVLSGLFQEITEGTTGRDPFETSGDAIPSFISLGTGECPFIVRNGLEGLAVHYVFCSPSESDSWGDDLLGPSILGTGAELQLNLEPGTYDIQIYDSMERPYTLWEVELDENGVIWEVTSADLDR